MHQNQATRRQTAQSSGGCGRIAVIGGGCVVILLFGFISVVILSVVFWDRGTEAGGNALTSWATDRWGSDISGRAIAIDDITTYLPEAREFDNQEDYLRFLDAYFREFGEAMEELGRLMSNPQLGDDAWADQMARQIAIVRHLETEAQSATPPSELQSAHDHWVEGMGEYRQAVDSAASAIDNFSASQLMDSLQSMNRATRSYINMGRELDELGLLDDSKGLLDQLSEPEQQ